MRSLYRCIVFCAMLFFVRALSAQDIAIKSNLLYDATATINGGVEMSLSPRWSAELTGNLNPWTFSDGKRWKNWSIQPEVRYWFCDALAGHFIGAHLLGGRYNIGGVSLDFDFLGTDFSKLKHNRYQGWFAGAGIAYGYSWLLGKHWNLEAEIGFGWTYTRYDRYPCAECGTKLDHDRPHNYVGPTKAAVNLVYVF